MKHIEQIQPEYAAVELSRLLVADADATASAALSRLLHDWTGCAIHPTSDTPQSEVEELVPLCLSILRRHWTTPLTALGDGTTPMSLADLMRRLIGDRVQGNEAWCIPPVHDNIPHAVAALRERKISGVPDAPDGVSFPRLLCDSTIPPITELIDDNIGWDYADGTCNTMLTLFPNATNLVLGCKTIKGNGKMISNKSSLQRVEFPHLESYGKPTADLKNGIIYNCPNVTELLMPSLSYVSHYSRNEGSAEWAMVGNMANLQKVVLGTLKTFAGDWTGYRNFFIDCPKLINLEIGQGSSASMNLHYWNPTTALADNLSLFLSNFRLYIADRLSDNGSGKTLTLSQEVRDAIHSAGIDTIITNKGWTISPVPTQQ